MVTRVEACGLAEWKVKRNSEGQRRLDREIGIASLRPSPSFAARDPTVNDILVEPDRQVTPAPEATLVFRPVFNRILGLVLWVHQA